MLTLDTEELALITAAVARVSGSKAHTFQPDVVLDTIGLAISANISVYDWGKKGEKGRFIRFNFDNEDIEILVCPQPEYIAPPLVDGPNDDPGGTPIAVAA